MNDISKIIRANYLQPAFLICAAMLAVTAGAMSAVIKISGAYLKKEPLPLKNPLSTLDKFPLAPYTVADKQRIENPDVIDTLQTEDYIQWFLEDTSASQADKTRYCALFITYYSIPDVVPHRPEECYIGGGYQQVSSDEVTLKIKSASSQADLTPLAPDNGIRGQASSPDHEIPPANNLLGQEGQAGQVSSPQANSERQIGARYIVFASTSPDLLTGDTTFSVLYIFSVNGQYCSGRDQARRILNKNLFGKFSYFSKVEWKFYGNNFGRIIYPDKQEAVAASEKLLKVILPVLEQQCWPSGLW